MLLIHVHSTGVKAGFGLGRDIAILSHQNATNPIPYWQMRFFLPLKNQPQIAILLYKCDSIITYIAILYKTIDITHKLNKIND